VVHPPADMRLSCRGKQVRVEPCWFGQVWTPDNSAADNC